MYRHSIKSNLTVTPLSVPRFYIARREQALTSRIEALSSQLMKSISILSLATSLSCLSVGQAEEFVWKDLFNGKDLSNWVDVNTSPDTWYFEDGLLKCKGLPIGVMRSEKQYENFVLEIEWRHMEDGGNSGVFIWSEGTTGTQQRPTQRHGGTDAGVVFFKDPRPPSRIRKW